MPTITLPDGSKRSFDRPVTGADVARDIGAGLAKAALAMRLNGTLVDLAKTIDTDAEVAIVTAKSPEALGVLRHDVAHLMAEAVKELYPDTQVTIGPAIENGFYYDFARAHPFTPDDLEKIEARMHEIVARDEAITREEWQRDDAVKFFSDQGEKYKAEIIASIPATEPIGLYRQGNFIDLCRGPHLPSTGKVGKAFKLMKVAGAYWRGDSKNEMLQRIYGTAWFDEKELKAYLTQIEEAEKRDHRRIGKEMDLFHLQEDAAGSVFWHPHGWTIYRLLETFIRTRLDAAGYVEVRTPQLVDRSLFIASGHWDMYGDNMYKVAFDDGNRMFGVKPMNCPCHIQIFNQGMKSYRDLPIRMAEFGSCHRNEPSGALHGIMRVRAFTQDDAHIFCTPEQIADESIAFCKLTMDAYRDLGFTDVAVKLATRPDKRLGTDAIWDRAEAGLAAAVEAAGLEHEVLPGEGAFYGPKLEFHLRDSIGRSWQCGTLQLDFNLPERLGSTYIAEDGAKHTPVMLHRAVLGSLERFIGMLIEHYAGRFPLWLAPVQVVVASITDDAGAYAEDAARAFRAAGLRAEADISNNKINFKVREHSLAKVPVLAVVGKREAETRSVALRHLGGADQEVLALDAAVAKLTASGRPPGAAQ